MGTVHRFNSNPTFNAKMLDSNPTFNAKPFLQKTFNQI